MGQHSDRPDHGADSVAEHGSNGWERVAMGSGALGGGAGGMHPLGRMGSGVS